MAAFLGSSLGAGNDFLHPLHAAKLLPAEHGSPQGRGQPAGPGQSALPGHQLICSMLPIKIQFCIPLEALLHPSVPPIQLKNDFYIEQFKVEKKLEVSNII